MNPLAKALQDLGACDESIRYASTHATAQQAWEACYYPPWMAWLIARLDQRQGALIACLCARSVTHLTGERQAEIETLLGQVEAWAWGADVDMVPVRERLRSIRRAVPSPCVAAAMSAATTTSDNAAADDAACAANEAVYNAARSAAYDPIDFCNLIWAAVPTCPLAEVVTLELQFPSGTGEWVTEATYTLEEFIAKHRSGMWVAEIAGVRSLAVGESYWGGGGALPEWRVVRKS